MKGNREYKSDVFSMLLENKDYALALYNALNGSEYSDPELVEYTTLKNGISLSVRNDAAFLVNCDLNIYEHESTVCPNMPLRELLYFIGIIERSMKDKNLYGRSLMKIPNPHFVVFYNGTEKQPEKSVQRLSDAFEKSADVPELELICTVYNINPDNNQDLMEKCGFLREYTQFVEYVRTYERQDADLEQAITHAIDRCVEENVLRKFLMDHRAEVMKVMQLDYTFERQIELEKRASFTQGEASGIAKGLSQGLEQGRRKEVFISVQDGDYGSARGAQKLHLSEAEFCKQMEEAGYICPET